MNEAVFRFRATGDVDINSLEINYGSEAPSEEWCHAPYYLKVEDQQDNLYELRFPLSPFNVPENGRLTRECTVVGPIYVIPRLDVPIINVNLTIKQIACIDKLKCDELIDLIEVYINSDEPNIGPDGGTIEIERTNYDPYFTESRVSITDENGNNCSWARFDSDGNVVVSRRYFDEAGEELRKAIVKYGYTYSYELDIDDDNCYGEFEGEILQRARTCEEADIQLVTENVYFPSTGGTKRLDEIVLLSGLDADAFEIRDRGDIAVNGDAFDGVRQSKRVEYSSACGFTITTCSNSDENSNLLEDKLGDVVITYHNKYLEYCTFTTGLTVHVEGISCEELLSRTSIVIKINDTGDFIDSGIVNIGSSGVSFTVYIIGDKYADYFDMDEDECVIPQGVIIDGATFTIPENEDPFLVKNYRFVFKAGIINEEYSGYSTYGCSFEKSIDFVQEIYNEISDIGDITVDNSVQCEMIEQIPSEHLEYKQDCPDAIEGIFSGRIEASQSCDTIEELTDNSAFHDQACDTDFIDDMFDGEIEVNCE